MNFVRYSLLLTLAVSSLALAGGGGAGSPPPKQAVVLECPGIGGGNVKSFLVYTNKWSTSTDTLVQVTLRDRDVGYFFTLKRGGVLTPDEVPGSYVTPDVYVIDPNEAFSYRGSGAFGESTTLIRDLGNPQYWRILKVEGRLKVTRAKNSDVDGPEFVFSGNVDCGSRE